MAQPAKFPSRAAPSHAPIYLAESPRTMSPLVGPEAPVRTARARRRCPRFATATSAGEPARTSIYSGTDERVLTSCPASLGHPRAPGEYSPTWTRGRVHGRARHHAVIAGRDRGRQGRARTPLGHHARGTQADPAAVHEPRAQATHPSANNEAFCGSQFPRPPDETDAQSYIVGAAHAEPRVLR